MDLIFKIMVRSQYASTIAPPAPTLTVSSGSTTEAIAGTKNLWIYCRNRAGVTLFSPTIQFTIAANQKLEVTLPSAIRKAASDFQEIGIVISNDTVPQNGAVVATYPNYEADGVTLTTLPIIMNLFVDAHFLLRSSVIPTTNQVNGMRRLFDSANQIREWSDRLSDWVPVFPQNWNPYVATTTEEGGCDVDLADITDTNAIIFPEYASTGELSLPVKFWIVNNTNAVIPQGKRVRLSIATDAVDAGADDFKGLAQLTFLGYANTLTGDLDVSDLDVDFGTFTYQGDRVTNLTLPKPLLPNWAYILQVQMAFNDADVARNVAQGAILKIYPRLATDYSEYDPVGDLLGSYILSSGELRRILPDGTGLNLVAGTGGGSIAFYKFRNLGRQITPGAIADTANQNVIITNNGTCFVANSVPTATAALRAIVGAINGVGHPTAWSSSIALDTTKLLSIAITHPTAIRPDYPDVIAGMQAGLNASKVRVYVRNVLGGSIQVFDVPITQDSPESILIGSLVTSTISELPSVAANFGCFTPSSFVNSAVAGSSQFTTGNYEVAIAYLYENTITTITHSTALGCVYEVGGSLAELFELLKIIGGAIANPDVARALEVVYPYQKYYITSLNAEFRYLPDSYAEDDGVTVLKLNSTNVLSPGRFHIIATGGGSGGTVDFDSILTDGYDVLVDSNGNVLTI